MSSAKDYLFNDALKSLDPNITELISLEEARQTGKLLMIPSESICPKPVRDALATPFSNKYAEGYASTRMTQRERDRVEKEIDRYLAFHRRYGDRRFYKGAEYSNIIEVLAQRRAAEIFANKRASADEIFVNVQSLSGAAANNAVYNAFLLPGDTIMGMSLAYGGHLTHGSPFNRSGRFYKVIPYTVDFKTGKFDYDAIKQMALEHKPKIIIGGASAYPWGIDWARLREIADSVPIHIPGRTKPGAVLLADISHPSGLVVAGLFPNPVGYADVTTLTTHKTLCGPRGAIILTTDEETAQRIDLGVFPGEQGGPHLNNIAAKAVCFKIAQGKDFKELQHKIVENAKTLADELKRLGLTIAYGGTNTHMVLIDLDSVKSKSGIPLKGDIASNILDVCGITCNKNALPGDETGARPRGIRFGTPVLTQQGFGIEDIKKIAKLIHKVLSNTKTFKVIGPTGDLMRGKLDLDVIEEVKGEVAKLTGAKTKSSKANAIEIIGERATAFLNEITTSNIFALKPDDIIQNTLLNSKGKALSQCTLQRLKDTKHHEAHYILQPEAAKYDKVLTWFNGLSDGYILFDDEDLYAKIDGPVLVRPASGAMRSAPASLASSSPWRSGPSGGSKTHDTRLRAETHYGVQARPTTPTYDIAKPYFIGQRHIKDKSDSVKSEFKFIPYSGEPRQTILYNEHLKLTKKQFLIPFAGWSMPVWYTRASEEHEAVRKGAGLFDVSHMGRLEIRGAYATRFLDLVTTNFVPKLAVGEAHYSYILDPDGNVMDDIFLYYLGINYYFMVVNAANAEKIKQWLIAVNERKVIIDRDHPEREIEGKVTITDVRPALHQNGTGPAPENPNTSRHLHDKGTFRYNKQGLNVNMALQGPKSMEVLLRLIKGVKDERRLLNLKRSFVTEVTLGGIKSLVARTGYTGEEIGFEIMTDAADAPKIWNMILDQGKDLGVKATGLAARDSTRTEAGLPLYGHELAGKHNISSTETGYGSFIKRHKPFFIGRAAYLAKEAKSKKTVVRFEIMAQGVRAIKPEDSVVDGKGTSIGVVTSCTLVSGKQIGLAHVDEFYANEGAKIAIFRLSVKKDGDKALPAEPAMVVSRFPLRVPIGLPALEA